MLRIKQRQSGVYSLTAQAVDEDGAVQAITAPYGITVKDGAGTTVATGTPTYQSQTLTYSLAASALAHLDTYSITWTGTVSGNAWSWTSELELVGGYLFEISDLRSQDRAFDNATKYPAELMRAARTAVEETIEGKKAANVAFVPRARRATVDGTGSQMLTLPDFEVRSVISVKVDGVALTQTELDLIIVDDNTLVLSSGWWPAGVRNVIVHYTHGRDRSPGPIARAGLMLAREYLVKSDLPGRATATSIGDQLFRLTVAGRDGVTGLPEVDAAIKDHGRSTFGIG